MDADVIVVGAGPVGLLAGLRLVERGLRPLLLERRSAPSTHSRAIGVHPPSLEILERLDLAGDLVAAGVPVRGGRAVGAEGELGRLDFGHLQRPFPFALSVPQGTTERILSVHLDLRAPGALRRGQEVVAFEEGPDHVAARLANGGEVRAPVALGCDGKGSRVREALGIPYDGGSYGDTFVMGDFQDTTDLGEEAVLFLHPEGLVESFPLPGGLRRWVCWVRTFMPEPTPDDLARIVQERTGLDLGGARNTMLSPFGVQHHLARRFHGERTLLAGDAAHVVSPIGGQGMNLGFMDAWDGGAVLAEAGDRAVAFQAYTRRRQKVARRATARAARYMTLGVGGWWNPVRDLAVRLLLRSPMQGALARTFTMRGLEAHIPARSP